MHPSRPFALVAATLLAWQCPGQTAPDQPAPARSFQLDVKSTGGPSLRKIRFMAPLGAVFEVRLQFNQTVTWEAGGKVEDAVHAPEVVVKLRVEAVDYPDGSGTLYQADIADTDVNSRLGVKPEDLKLVKEYFDKERGRRFTFAVGPRGQSYSFTDRLPEDDEPVVNSLGELFRSAVRELSIWVPSEDVGPGASWVEHISSIEGGPSWAYIESRELSQSGSDKLSIRSKLRAEQKLGGPPKAPIPGKTEQLGATGSGSSRATLVPGAAFPEEVETRTEFEFRGRRVDPDTSKAVATRQVTSALIRVSVKPERPAKPAPPARK